MDFAAWHSVVTDDNGAVVPQATITVRHTDTGALARLYNARDGSEPKGNPFQTGADGMISFFASGGAYTVIAAKGTLERRWSFVPIGTAQEYDIDSLAEYLNSGVVYFQTFAGMSAHIPLTYPAAAVVLADPDGSKNGYYTNSGSGWLFARTMPDSIARATIYNNTDVNSPKANISQGINPSSPIVFFLDVASPNTGSVTLTIDGIGTGAVLNAAGNALSAGEWLGRVMLTREQDGRFRIVNDPASAIAAAISATQAGEARDDAVTAKDLAEIFADDASESADNAAVSEGNAASSASNAAGSATAAASSASDAASSASTATTKASEAAASATAAAGSASTASTKAGEAASSASDAASSATTATNQANRAETEADRAEAAAGGLIDAVQFVPQTLTPAQQDQARQNIQADKSYDSIASVASATVPAFANAIRTNGYYAAGDGGGALYKRVTSEPSHAGKVQSADGAWWELSERDVTVEMFGGVGSMTAAGVSSLSDIIPSLNDAVIYQNMNNGGKIYLTCKYYKQMTQFVFGNGSATQSSTINGIEIYGKSGKVTDAEFDASKSHGTTFQWYGPQSVNTLDSQVSILGPLNSCVIQDITFDGRGLRSTIFKANMMYFCRIVGVHCINWSFRGWHLETYSADYPIPGFSQWFFSNTFERCVVRMPVYDGPQQPHCAAWMGGDIVKNVGFSRNHFILCDFGTPDGASCFGLYLAMIDNNTFDRCFVFYDNGDPTGPGKGVYMERCGPDMYDLQDKFPCDNIFLNCPVFGGYHGASGTAGNLVIGYPTIDLQPEPNMDYLYVISCDGRMYGNMRGSAVQWAGAVTPSGLGDTRAYLSPVGYSEPQQWADDAELIIPGDVVISAFTVSLGVAPGGTATRKFTVYKNGVATAATITFTSSQAGYQTWTYSNGITNSGVKFSRGDLMTIQSEVTGTPANAKCKYSIELLPR